MQDQHPYRPALEHDLRDGRTDLQRLLPELALKPFSLSDVGTLLAAADGRLVKSSESLSRLLGYEPGSLRNSSLQELVHPGDLLLHMHHLSRLAAGQSTRYSAEMRLMHRSGEPLPMFVSAFAVGEDTDAPRYIYMQVQDLSGRLRAESALQDSLLHLHSLLETMTDAYLMLGREGEFLYMNRSAEELLGRSRTDLLGRSCRVLMPEWYGPVFYRSFQRGLEEGVPLSLQEHFPSEQRWLELHCRPCKPGLSVFVRDVTRHKAQEEKLRATKQQLDSMIEHAADNIVILDSSFRLLRVNQAFLDTFGFSEEELIGRRPPNIPDELWIESELLFRQAFQGKQISGFETVRRRKDGLLLDMSLTISPIVGADHHIPGICIIGRDISEHKRTEELLRSSEKLAVAGQLAAGVAHEIRNPLTSLKGFTQFMKAGAQYKEQYLDIMMSELDRIEQIISELLLLARPQAVTYRTKPLEPILTHVISLLEPQANLQNVELLASIPSGLPPVYCEENHLKQVFINLMKNALEAMPRGGRLELAASASEEDGVCVTLEDNGPGIPAELLKRLGEPFFTTKEKGSGLGLMVSQKIVAEHGGRLSVDSREGGGTTVTVVLPQASERTDPASDAADS
ncbi:PAS domain-containing sensor histidine kinase [Paenibacillus mucilaginosus]|uniref:PAS domain-containing sensor histidine kinase n=1 Tax=Paenibacillus mucilaginosus TaxID=61624 RepID=UPI0005A038B4|nr:PAS domain S-box protein [Paenibacillus mucilaginosus]MCG7217785.1 PAS domain S-box protein [Paenibacillus mucilaginosus]WDM27242.1 PAS domain S-box protein [Paenibacillus mucilaginosus]